MYTVCRKGRCFMKHILALALMLGAIFSTACASVPVGGGMRVYPLGVPPQVVVTNGTKTDCDVYRNGQMLGVIPAGETRNITLGYVVGQVVLNFKAFEVNEKGQKVIVGYFNTTVYRSGGYGQDFQELTIYYFQPLRESAW